LLEDTWIDERKSESAPLMREKARDIIG